MPFELTNPPQDERARELWLQHAAGFILFQDMRNYAIDKIPEEVDELTKEKVIAGIDDTIYGLMMMMDGVTGSLSNEQYSVTIKQVIQLNQNGETVQEINTLDGDGMCMGFHGWLEGDYGEGEIFPAIETGK